MASRPFCVATGLSLLLAGLLLIGINAVLSPLLPQGGFAELAALTALLMLFGVIGLHLDQMRRAGAFGGAAFALAVAGAVALFSVEWNRAFTIRDFAQQAPATLEAVEDAKGLTPFDIGALIAAAAFFLGWFVFALSLFFANVFSRIGAALAAIGFFLALIGSSIVIGVGWVLLGLGLMRWGEKSPA